MDIISTFVKTVGVYPPGCIVELSDGNLGIVVAANKMQSTHPVVLLYDKATPREKPLIIDLNSMGNVDIVRSILPAEAPPEAISYLQYGEKTSLYLGSLINK
jgi:hypothetical protein